MKSRASPPNSQWSVNAEWVAHVRKTSLTNLLEGLPWFSRRERMQLLRSRLRKLLRTSKQQMLFADSKRRKRQPGKAP